MAKTLYLYEPINNYKHETNYKKLQKITGVTLSTLAWYKSKREKVANLNCYIIDDNVTKKELYELMCKEGPKGEVWKELENSNGTYLISDYGRFKRIYKNGKEKMLVPYIRTNGRKAQCIKLTINGVYKEHYVHQIVAQNFLPNKEGYECVRHKDGNIYKNRAYNLQWIDRAKLCKMVGGLARGIPVVKIDPITGEELDFYENMTEAGRENYLHKETIRLCVRGKTKTAGGFIWKVDKEVLNAI